MKWGGQLGCVLSLTLATGAIGCAWAAKEEFLADAARGEALYKRYCRGCHGEEGKGEGVLFAPPVNDFTKKGYIDQLPDSYLLLAIAKGGPAINNSSYMPGWEGALSMQEMLDLIAYLRSLGNL